MAHRKKKSGKSKKQVKVQNGVPIGIDFGTCYSCVSVWRNDAVETIVNDQGNRTTPSWVAFTDAECILGEAAMNQSASNPQNTVFGMKQLLGQSFTSPALTKLKDSWPFTIIKSETNLPLVEVSFEKKKKKFTAEEICGMALSKMKSTAVACVGTDALDVVLTAPAHFNAKQQAALRKAASKAGLNVLSIIKEPIAVAIAYGLDQPPAPDSAGPSVKSNVLVFDLGAATLDISLIEIQNGFMRLVKTENHPSLGGENFVDRLVKHFCQQFSRKNRGLDLSKSIRAQMRLRQACERCKRNLTKSAQGNVNIDSLYEGADIYETISRARFESLCNDLFQECLQALKKVVSEAGIIIDQVLMAGGGSRMPKMKVLIQRFMKNVTIKDSIIPDEVIAAGAAIQASFAAKILAKKPPTPTVKTTALTLGIEVLGGLMIPIIHKNTGLPCTNNVTFCSKFSPHNTPSKALIKVYEGERALAQDNKLLGMLDVQKIPTAGTDTKVIVSLSVDENGTLTVEAKHGNGNSEKLTIDPLKDKNTKQKNNSGIKPEQHDLDQLHRAWFKSVSDLYRRAEDFQQKLVNVDECKEDMKWCLQQLNEGSPGRDKIEEKITHIEQRISECGQVKHDDDDDDDDDDDSDSDDDSDDDDSDSDEEEDLD